MVVGFDFTAQGATALRQGYSISKVNDGEIHVVHSLHRGRHGTKPDGSHRWRRPTIEHSDEAREEIQQHISTILPANSTVTIHVLIESPAQALLTTANYVKADMIVIGAGESSVVGRLLGSTVETVTTNAPCPVLVSRPVRVYEDEREDLLEEPCPDCVRTRVETHRKEYWCEAHRTHTETHVIKNEPSPFTRRGAFVLW